MNFQFDNLIWGISERKDGQMKFDDSDLKEILSNRKKYFENLGVDINNLVSAGLTHGDNIAVVGQKDKGKIIADADGLTTDQKNLFLTITVADCAPIYFYDQKKKIIGIAHAGWRGVIKNISKSLIDKMTRQYNCRPEDIVVYIGPHIQKCHFEVKEDVAVQFKKDYSDSIISKKDYITVDLSGVIKRQLAEIGVKQRNINVSDECTYESNKYFSFRRDKPENPEAMIAYMGMV